MARKATNKKIELTREILEDKRGADFDRAFLGHQVVAHIDMLAKLQAMEDMGSQQFQSVVKQGIAQTEEHLQHARALYRTVEGQQSGERTTERPEATPAPQPER